jgi:hypothetical protein
VVFKGVPSSEEHHWEKALPADDPKYWTGVVGVDVDKASNSDMFRVLEWGGMEVS